MNDKAVSNTGIKNKKWLLQKPDETLQDLFANELKITRLTAQLLINRGIDTVDNASVFLSPALKNLHNPFLLKDMDKAVFRIIDAVQKKEDIVIYGDYDVDGTAGASVLYLFLKETGAKASCYIPERLKEGYGLNKQALQRLAENGVKLVVTTDCGISNYDEVWFANGLGLDVIITDHHEVTSEIPPAYAVLNPKQKTCRFPFKELAGVGVAFNLIIALRTKMRELGRFPNGEPHLKDYLDIVALGTIADMVPLVDENRVFAMHGIESITKGERCGIKALKDVARLNGNIKSWHISFQLAPRINAAGRLKSADTAVKLLTTNEPDEAYNLARELDDENCARQSIEGGILKEAIDEIEREGLTNAIVLASEKWHQGVIGVVASKLVDMYYRPTVLISLADSIGKGSARGIKAFHILEGLRTCSHYLKKFGGHKTAAGLTIDSMNIRAFKEAFLNIAAGLKEEDLVPELSLDAYIDFAELNKKTTAEIFRLAPFGFGNPEPLLCANDVKVIGSQIVGANHLRFKTRHKSQTLNAIAYKFGALHPLDERYIDIAFTPYIDEWNGNADLRLNVKDIRLSK